MHLWDNEEIRPDLNPTIGVKRRADENNDGNTDAKKLKNCPVSKQDDTQQKSLSIAEELGDDHLAEQLNADAEAELGVEIAPYEGELVDYDEDVL